MFNIGSSMYNLQLMCSERKSEYEKWGIIQSKPRGNAV